MHVSVCVAAPYSAFNALVVIAEEYAFPDLGPIGRPDCCGLKQSRSRSRVRVQ